MYSEKTISVQGVTVIKSTVCFRESQHRVEVQRLTSLFNAYSTLCKRNFFSYFSARLQGVDARYLTLKLSLKKNLEMVKDIPFIYVSCSQSCSQSQLLYGRSILNVNVI